MKSLITLLAISMLVGGSYLFADGNDVSQARGNPRNDMGKPIGQAPTGKYERDIQEADADQDIQSRRSTRPALGKTGHGPALADPHDSNISDYSDDESLLPESHVDRQGLHSDDVIDSEYNSEFSE